MGQQLLWFAITIALGAAVMAVFLWVPSTLGQW